MVEILIFIAVNAIAFAIGWFLADRVINWIDRSRYSRFIKASLHTLLWGTILIGGLVNGIPMWLSVLTVVAYVMSLIGVLVD